MKIFHSSAKRKIICSGCGQRAAEAGYAVSDLDFENAAARNGMIEKDKMQPLCEDCFTTLCETMFKGFTSGDN
jgi:hypothetical protein